MHPGTKVDTQNSQRQALLVVSREYLGIWEYVICRDYSPLFPTNNKPQSLNPTPEDHRATGRAHHIQREHRERHVRSLGSSVASGEGFGFRRLNLALAVGGSGSRHPAVGSKGRGE